MKINENYKSLETSYLFSTIAKKLGEYTTQNPEAKVIKMGIGDVTLPLAEKVISEMHKAVDEMGSGKTFRGYGPEQGYDFLKDEIKNYYEKNGVTLDAKEIFISDGAKSDIGNILNLFSKDNVVLVPDPVYPVYVDTNIMDGRTIKFLNANAENGFLPLPDDSIKADLIYICSPNNPTGACYSHTDLTKWVRYAKEQNAVILFDAAYEAFVQNGLPRSIFEIEGAETCAIEFCSFSKTAGFTGTRCGYTVVPFALKCGEASLNQMWLRRQTTKFNGVPYIVQRGAAAIFSDEGHKQIQANLDYYRTNGKTIADTMEKLGVFFTGGKNSPYVWFRCPDDLTSWQFFDILLREANVVGTPGSGFGENGEGFFRLTSFQTHENTVEAMERLCQLYAKKGW